jgi:hypothetical protein
MDTKLMNIFLMVKWIWKFYSGVMAYGPTSYEGSYGGFTSSNFTVLELDPEGEMGIWLGDLAHCS